MNPAGISDGKKHISKLRLAAILLLAVLLGGRVLLPWAARNWINRNLQDLPGYRARVEAVDLDLWRGAYEIRKLSVTKASGKASAPLFYAERIVATIAWKGSRHRPFTVGMEVFGAKVNLIRGMDLKGLKARLDMDWSKVFRKLSFVEIGKFRIHEGEMRFQDYETGSAVDLSVRNVEVTLDFLLDQGKGEDARHAVDFRAEGLTVGRGSFALRIRLDPEASRPKLDMDFSLDSLDLKPINSALKAYAGMEVVSGRLDMQTHASALAGRFHGTIQAELNDFAVGNPFKKHEGPVQILKEEVVKGLGKIPEKKSEKKDSVGGKPPEISFSGRFPDQVQDAGPCPPI